MQNKRRTKGGVMYQVMKRDGKVVDFDVRKISAAIAKAFDGVERQYHPTTIDMLALQTTADFEPKVFAELIDVEAIQDSVERVLSNAGYADVAKAYILYRRNREKIRNTKNSLLDYKATVDKYLKVEDWRVKENSTVTYSVGGLILSNSGAITANYWLSEIYDDEIANAHRDADIHIHDLSMLTGYCAGWSIKQLIQEGLGGISGKITSKPAKHLQSNGQLLGHHAKRVGGRPGVFEFRYLSCPLRESGRLKLRRGQKVD